jgi:hypothetical protein
MIDSISIIFGFSVIYFVLSRYFIAVIIIIITGANNYITIIIIITVTVIIITAAVIPTISLIVPGVYIFTTLTGYLLNILFNLYI